MILVNISAVGTSTTFTLIPVSSSHFGPEKSSGSKDCRPASQTMVMVVPAYCLAAATARSAALSADAEAAQPRLAPTRMLAKVRLPKIFIASSPFGGVPDRAGLPRLSLMVTHRTCGYHNLLTARLLPSSRRIACRLALGIAVEARIEKGEPLDRTRLEQAFDRGGEDLVMRRR